MLNLDTKINVTEAVTKSPNLCSRFTEEDLAKIGTWVYEGYVIDEQSREAWFRRTEAAMDLAMQVVKAKTFPWPGASNVKFPLVTVAAMQFHARAYPALVPPKDIVKCRVLGADKEGLKFQQALLVQKHMSYQLLEEDPSWEEGMDRLLINLPIVGTVFKKSYHSSEKRRNVSEVVLARDLVVNYHAPSLEDASRVSHLIPMHRNKIHARCKRGAFRDVTGESWFDAPAQVFQRPEDSRQDVRTGERVPTQSDETTPFTCIEQHCLMDLDQDGYYEPYIVTIEISSRSVLRIVAAWNDFQRDVERTERGAIIAIKRTNYFTKYGFIPSPDNAIYDLGFGVLLGPINSSVDTIINQLVDVATMASTAGGFLGRGVKMRGGKFTFSPLEWQKVDSMGDDLRKDIVPLPVREPSAVMLSLLSLLIEYANRIPGTTDVMVGENVGQNTPAQTAQTMVEQGGKIFGQLFKRVWRNMKQEFKKVYILNGTYLPNETYFGDEEMILREAYLGNPDMIVPSADPNVVSEQQRLQRIMAISQRAMAVPGYSLPEVEKAFLREIGAEDVDRLYPGPDKVPPLPNPKVQVEQMKLQGKQMQLQSEQQQFVASLMEERRLNSAKILELETRAAKQLAEAKGVQDGHQLAVFELALGALKAHDDSLMRRIEVMQKGMKDGATDGTGVPGLAGTPGDQGGPAVGAQAPGIAQGGMG